MLTHLDWSSLIAAGPYLIQLVSSAVRCWLQLPLSVSHRQLTSLGSFFQLLTRVPLPISSHVEDHGFRPLFGFAPKQTKGSSAWRTLFIVSHMVRLQLFNTMVGTQLNLSKSSKFSAHLFWAWCHPYSSLIFCLGFIMTMVIVISFVHKRKLHQLTTHLNS